MAETNFTQNKTNSLTDMEIKLIALFNGMDDVAKMYLIAKAVELSDLFPFKELIKNKKFDNSFH